MSDVSFQQQGSVEHCFGCGAGNKDGLQLESYWDGKEKEAIATFSPKRYHCGGSPDIVYGGLIASLIDCHTCNLAIAHLYREENRSIASEPKIECLTAQLNVTLLKATPMGEPVYLRARVRSVERRKVWVECDVTVAGELTARGEVLAIRLKDQDSAQVGLGGPIHEN